MGVIFKDDFESGTLSAWSWLDGSPTVQTAIKYLGSYAAKIDAGNTGCIFDASSYSDFFARAYFSIVNRAFS